MNLHECVRGIITALNPDMPAKLYRSLGQTNTKGRITACYAEPLDVMLQVQMDKAEPLKHEQSLNNRDISRRVWLNAPDHIANPVNRVLARSGDWIKMTDEGSWWLVTEAADAFQSSGWQSVRMTAQSQAPKELDDGSASVSL